MIAAKRARNAIGLITRCVWSPRACVSRTPRARPAARSAARDSAADARSSARVAPSPPDRSRPRRLRHGCRSPGCGRPCGRFSTIAVATFRRSGAGTRLAGSPVSSPRPSEPARHASSAEPSTGSPGASSPSSAISPRRRSHARTRSGRKDQRARGRPEPAFARRSAATVATAAMPRPRSAAWTARSAPVTRGGALEPSASRAA
jgi:hypothetical protein